MASRILARSARRGEACSMLFAVASAALVATGCGDDAVGPGSGGGGAGGVGGGGSGAVGATGSSSSSSGTGGTPELPYTFEVSGVVTDGLSPIEGAIVMQGGGDPSFRTGPDGTFTLELTHDIPGLPAIVAAKEDYRATGFDFYELPTEPLELVLVAVEPPDNTAYVFGNPGVGIYAEDDTTDKCGHCHTLLTAQFQTSGHARATRNERLQDLYAGVSRAHTTQAACTAAGGTWRAGLEPGTTSTPQSKCYLGGGVLPDLNPCGAPAGLACDDPALPAASAPTDFGACADCHAIAIDGPAGGRDLHDAVGLAFENGNHCDACHHIRDVDLTQPAGLGGALMMQRPHEKLSNEIGAPPRQALFGPYPDVPNQFMGGVYQPKFATSEFCGGCHEQRQPALLPGSSLDPTRWPDGLPTLSTYSEWAAGPFNVPTAQCRACHMPAVPGLFNTVDVTTAETADTNFGFARPEEDIRSHEFLGPLSGTPRLVDTAVQLSLSAIANAGTLTVNITASNAAAGHAVPTGEPMRAVILLVHVEGCGETFAATGGMTVPDFGGATAAGVIGVDVAAAGTVLTWPAGAALAQPGDRVRVVRPSGTFDDYPAVGFFADPTLTPAEKGMEIMTPVGTATVVSAAAGAVTVDTALATAAGDRVWLGDDPGWPITDGQASSALSGAPGYAFGRVTVDPSGARGVPHYRAVDLASDNRIPPATSAATTHAFAIPNGCTSADVSAVLLYRRWPVDLSRQRGWSAVDYVMASKASSVSLP